MARIYTQVGVVDSGELSSIEAALGDDVILVEDEELGQYKIARPKTNEDGA